ncbi:hypothetical protein [Pseudoduganella sp.]|uniref:hypothetical protein n=1 Tax=Pseudoduganella sp. TaxID=1880898 RepID=UPI0035B26182
MITQTARLPRQACLAAIACLHLAAFLAWRSTPPPARPALPQRASDVVFLQLPAARPAASVPPASARRAVPARGSAVAPGVAPLAGRGAPPGGMPGQPAAPAMPASPDLPGALADAPAPVPPVLPDDPFARPATPAASTLARARLAAAGVDRQLRKESLNRFATIVDEEKADRYSINGPAYRAPPPPESFADARGIVHKRYMLRGKMVCEEVDHVSYKAISKGSQARLVRCPK